MKQETHEQVPDEKQIRKAWEYHNAGDVLFAARFNYYMVAQSMMLVSFVTVFVSNQHSWGEKVVEIMVAIAGLCYAGIQWRVNRVLPRRLEKLRDQYLRYDVVFREYLVVNAKQAEEAGNIQSKYVPLAFSVLWIVLGVAAVTAPASQTGWRPATQGQEAPPGVQGQPGSK